MFLKGLKSQPVWTDVLCYRPGKFRAYRTQSTSTWMEEKIDMDLAFMVSKVAWPAPLSRACGLCD